MPKANQIFVLLVLFLGVSSYSQDRGKGSKKLDKLITEKEFVKADSVLNATIAQLNNKKDYLYLCDMIFYVGKLSLEKHHDKTLATTAVTSFMNTISIATDSAKVRRQVELGAASFYELIGNSQKAYECNLAALKWTHKWKKATGADYGKIQNNLGVLADRTGDMTLALSHVRKAMRYFESDPKTDKADIYNCYNSMGANMWNISKVDSALYYFKKSETVLNSLEKTPDNIYGQAILQNNMAAIYSTQGNLNKALESMKIAINALNVYLKLDDRDTKKSSAKEFLYSAIENYGGLYKDLGDYQKALELYTYNYNEKKKYFNPDHPELFKATVSLGQIYLDLRDYERANLYLEKSISHIERTPGNNYIWNADAHFAKAKLNDALNQTIEAKENFEAAELLYQLALNGAYDEIYLNLIVTASHFYAKNNGKEKALKMAQKAYDYIKDNQGVNSSFEIQQTLNLGELYFELQDYSAALAKSNENLDLLKKTLPTQGSIKDSTVIYTYQPLTMLLKTQSKYQLQNIKNASFLSQQLATIDTAIAIIEQQKKNVGDETNVSILLEDNSRIFEFGKKLSLELYEQTKNKKYLNKVISLNESILYNRIRSHLNASSSMVYNNVPQEVLKKEKTLKSNLRQALKDVDNMAAYFNIENEWKSYLKMLKSKYPKYYNLRFASISKSLDNLSKKVPENSTIVRYTYIDDGLYAMVISRDMSEIYKINQENLSETISKFQNASNLMENHFKDLHQLYSQLWKPFENVITTENVIIIPDRDLFNLSFEMLTPKVISSYKEMATNSLLSKYVISYNYSLFLLDSEQKSIGYKEDFVAFVPEFDEKMKDDYKFSIRDSMSLDKAYLTLLPQPFTKSLAENSTRLFKGKSFLNENSTEQIFKNNAKEHKIIHIGTHAESNNLSPELSRLVFAKSSDTLNTDDNYLYTYEIYNTNLSSNLAILTACETGKPTYQAGEGMISLAHAFNYAGSESILTSLWKIDEQSSAKIVAIFYDNIKKGMSKDKALQQAKLTYISNAEGRTINPEYWAGLVLIGDTSPIELNASMTWIYWVFGGLFIVIVLFFLLRSRRSQ